MDFKMERVWRSKDMPLEEFLQVMKEKNLRGKTKRCPDRIPVILKRSAREESLPFLRNEKYLVKGSCGMWQLLCAIRRALSLHPYQPLFLMVKNKGTEVNMLYLDDVYDDCKDDDGYLRITYQTQKVFCYNRT